MHKIKFYQSFFNAVNVRGFYIDHELLLDLISQETDDDCKCLILPWLEYLERSYDEKQMLDILDITDTWESAWLYIMPFGVKYVGNNEYLIFISKLYD